jgi:hypothetical protein
MLKIEINIFNNNKSMKQYSKSLVLVTSETYLQYPTITILLIVIHKVLIEYENNCIIFNNSYNNMLLDYADGTIPRFEINNLISTIRYNYYYYYNRNNMCNGWFLNRNYITIDDYINIIRSNFMRIKPKLL